MTAVQQITAVEAALERLEGRAREAAEVPEPGNRRIVVLSPKGGSGRTTISTNLAVALGRRRGCDVGLADLSLAFGDVASALLLDPRAGLSRLARAPRPFTTAAVTTQLTRHESGVHVLCAPENPVESEAFDADDVATLLEGLSATLPRLVVDTAAGLDATTLVAAERATDLVLVANLDVPNLLGLRQALDLLDRLGMTAARRHVVLNRGGMRNGVEVSDLVATLGLPVAAIIPDSRAVAASTNEGRPIVLTAPRSAPARAFEALATRFDPAPAVSAARAFARLRGVKT